MFSTIIVWYTSSLNLGLAFIMVSLSMQSLSLFDIFFPSGGSISPHLFCCDGFAVVYHSFIRHASYLGQSQPVNISDRCMSLSVVV